MFPLWIKITSSSEPEMGGVFEKLVNTLLAEENEMNAIIKYLTFVPTLVKYLKGGMFVYDGKFDKAIQKLKPCLAHPSFQNELLYSYYGQALCGQGKLEEGHKYLIKACKEYEKSDWCFETDYKHNLAKNTLKALEHVLKHTSLIEGKEFLNKDLKIKQK